MDSIINGKLLPHTNIPYLEHIHDDGTTDYQILMVPPGTHQLPTNTVTRYISVISGEITTQHSEFDWPDHPEPRPEADDLRFGQFTPRPRVVHPDEPFEFTTEGVATILCTFIYTKYQKQAA